ncbi:hypothetical protein VQ056_26320 [Paenibacillus sp. JTLBN-2024]
MVMFDPTIFENLKVALENQLYDLDNIDGLIRIIGRDDRLEMSVMSREFAIRFELAGRPEVVRRDPPGSFPCRFVRRNFGDRRRLGRDAG